MAGEAPPLDMEIRRRPIRELRAVLTQLGRPTAGLVERGDFVDSLLEATIPELSAALGRCAEKGPQEKAALLRQLLDTSTKPDAAEVAVGEQQLPPGSVVRLFNLQSAPALNMQRALVVRFDPTTDRYEVRLDWDGSVKKVRYDNLQMEDISSPSKPSTRAGATSPAATQASSPLPATCSAPVVSSDSVPAAAPAAPEATISPEAPKAAEPAHELGRCDVPATPDCKRKREDSDAEGTPMQATMGASPTESLVDALAAECGLGEPAPASVTEEMVSEVAAASTRSAADPIVLPMPGVSLEGDAPKTLGTVFTLRQNQICCTTASLASAQESEVQNEVQTSIEAFPAQEACSEEHRAGTLETPSKAAPPFILPVFTGKCHEFEASAASGALASSVPKKALKLRVGYSVGQPPSEERGLLAEGLRELWRAGELCDVTLACRQSTFRVHRLVMACQSKELKDFLADRSEVQLSDISYPETLQILVEFLYEAEGEKGYAPSCSEVNMEVLDLAHKFQLPGLKRRAASVMAQGLTTHNVLRSLGDCDTFALEDLKEKIISHVAVNKKVLAEITEGPHISNYPELLRQILVRVASPKDSGGPSKRTRMFQ